MIETAAFLILESLGFMLGSLLNLFCIITFLLDKNFRNHNYIFWLNIMLHDFLMSTIGGITVYSMLTSGTAACRIFQAATEMSTYNTNIFLTLEFVHLFYRLSKRNSVEDRIKMNNFRFEVWAISIQANLVSFGVAFIGVRFDLDKDYCSYSHNGHSTFRILTRMLFYVIPFITSCIYFAKTKNMADHRCDRPMRYTPTHIYENDKILITLHLICFELFVIGWFPFMLMELNEHKPSEYYWHFLIVPGFLRTNLMSIIYIFGYKPLRQAAFKIIKRIFSYDSTTTNDTLTASNSDVITGRIESDDEEIVVENGNERVHTQTDEQPGLMHNVVRVYDEGHHQVEPCNVHEERAELNVQEQRQRDEAVMRIQNALSFHLRKPAPVRENIALRSVWTPMSPDPERSRLNRAHTHVRTRYV